MTGPRPRPHPRPTPSRQRPDALFVGLATLDVIQLVEHVPAPDEKLVASAQTVAAGGPAANAAVLHARLGGTAHLLTGVGRHPLAAGITADLARQGVHLHDLAAGQDGTPTVSTILVTRATGERAVASTNAACAALPAPDDPEALLYGRGAVLLDGHHERPALAVAAAARALGIPTVLDGGSFKPVTERLLPSIDIAVCSADFRPPGCATTADTIAYLHDHRVPWAVITGGPRPVRYSGPGVSGTVPVPPVRQVADTLGAGDFFHGALVHRLSAGGDLDAAALRSALAFAAATAARSIASFGTRDWLDM